MADRAAFTQKKFSHTRALLSTSTWTNLHRPLSPMADCFYLDVEAISVQAGSTSSRPSRSPDPPNVEQPFIDNISHTIPPTMPIDEIRASGSQSRLSLIQKWQQSLMQCHPPPIIVSIAVNEFIVGYEAHRQHPSTSADAFYSLHTEKTHRVAGARRATDRQFYGMEPQSCVFFSFVLFSFLLF